MEIKIILVEDLFYPVTKFMVQITSSPDAHSGAMVFSKPRLFCVMKKHQH